jgi:hypothetical protein
MQNIIDLVKKDTFLKEKISKYEHKRFLFDKLYKARPFKSILGLRGVGKTTLLAQLAIKHGGFYINLDDVGLKSANLLELCMQINERYGFEYFLLDEIQSLENWEYQIKDLFELTNFDICFSGSSIIDILEKSIDISRRVISYEIPPLSFREYLLFKKDIFVPSIIFEDLLDDAKKNKIIAKIAQYQRYFKEYLEFGAYPFGNSFESVIDSFKNILNKTIYVDFARIKNIDESSLQQVLKILKYISSGSDEVSFTSLSNTLGISKTRVISLFELLEKSMLVIRIEPKVIGKDLLKKHPKYSMLLPLRHLVNNIYGLDTQIGNLREDMFITSLFFRRKEVFFLKTASIQPDFYFNGMIFEVGGKSKGRRQLKNFNHSYLVKDSLDASKKEIPLILFGLLY